MNRVMRAKSRALTVSGLISSRLPADDSGCGMTVDHMKSPLEAPEKQIAEETSAKPEKPTPAAVIDTSKMAKGQREALELAEAARDPLEDRGSFASNLFVGRYDFNRIHPYPAQSAEDRAAGEEFLQQA